MGSTTVGGSVLPNYQGSKSLVQVWNMNTAYSRQRSMPTLDHGSMNTGCSHTIHNLYMFIWEKGRSWYCGGKRNRKLSLLARLSPIMSFSTKLSARWCAGPDWGMGPVPCGELSGMCQWNFTNCEKDLSTYIMALIVETVKQMLQCPCN